MINSLYYFGTSLTERGHYFWELEDTAMMRQQKLAPHQYLGHDMFPFNPYEIRPPAWKKQLDKGMVHYDIVNGYTICTIEGSCSDDRWGTVSVFFIKGNFSREEIMERIQQTPIAQQIIARMPFRVQW